MRAPASTTLNGPIDAVAATCAVRSTTALAAMPGVSGAAGCSSCATRAKVAYGLAETSFGSTVAPASAGATITALARVASSARR